MNHDSKQHLGFEEPQGWTRRSVERTAPLAMLLYSLIVLWFAREGHRSWRPLNCRWYTSKTQPSFADMLRTLRRLSVRQQVFDLGPRRTGVSENPTTTGKRRDSGRLKCKSRTKEHRRMASRQTPKQCRPNRSWRVGRPTPPSLQLAFGLVPSRVNAVPVTHSLNEFTKSLSIDGEHRHEFDGSRRNPLFRDRPGRTPFEFKPKKIVKGRADNTLAVGARRDNQRDPKFAAVEAAA